MCTKVRVVMVERGGQVEIHFWVESTEFADGLDVRSEAKKRTEQLGRCWCHS